MQKTFAVALVFSLSISAFSQEPVPDFGKKTAASAFNTPQQ